MDKDALRKSLQHRRSRLSSESIASRSEDLANQVQAHLDQNSFNQIFSFLQHASEPDMMSLHAKEGQLPIALPVIDPDVRGLMEFYKWSQGEPLHPNRFYIKEPAPAPERHVVPDYATLILVPGLAATANGVRIGYGGGYYDRYCARYPRAKRAIVLLDEFVVEDLPKDDHDVLMHYVITDKRVMNCLPKSKQN